MEKKTKTLHVARKIYIEDCLENATHMANIYITEEVLEELDHTLLEYNEKNAPTDRSGLIKYLIKKKK